MFYNNSAFTKFQILRKWTYAILILCILIVTFTNESNLGAKEKIKKIYISNINVNGTSNSLATKLRDGLKLSIFENYGENYQVLDDEAIKIMFKQAEILMASGCNDSNCAIQIAEGINADEIIYGNIYSENAEITLSLTNMERDPSSMTLGSKSLVNLKCRESELEHYIIEAGKKLINKAYSIKKMETIDLNNKISVNIIEIDKIGSNQITGVDISVLSFSTNDDAAAKILGYLKEEIGKGDVEFNKANYTIARAKYSEVLDKIGKKLTPASQLKISGFTEGVNKRISTTYANESALYALEIKKEIEKLDSVLQKKESASIKNLRNILKKYEKLEAERWETMPSYYRKHLYEIRNAIIKREDNINIALLSIYEKEGDTAYREYDFKTAKHQYSLALDSARSIQKNEKMLLHTDRLFEKIQATTTTGRNYLTNKVKTHMDITEYYNISENTSKAKTELEKAIKLIRESPFITIEIVDTYNKVYSLIGRIPCTYKSEPNVFKRIKENVKEDAKINELNSLKVKLANSKKWAENDENRIQKSWRNFGKMTHGESIVIGGIEFVRLKSDAFIMGSSLNDGVESERPLHAVATSGFLISRYEVTQSDYELLMNKNTSSLKDIFSPVDDVSWDEAIEFCNQFSKINNVKARLPYESEWEYASRAGANTQYYWGNEFDGKYSWYYVTANKLKPVGIKKANGFGLYDMSGNVFEWCMDWYNENYYSNSPSINPTGPKSGTKRVLRGGSSKTDDMRSSARGFDSPDNKSFRQGFRIVIPAPQ